MQLPPARADEHDAQRQARQRGAEKGETLGNGEEAGLYARNEVHRFAPEELWRRPAAGESVTRKYRWRTASVTAAVTLPRPERTWRGLAKGAWNDLDQTAAGAEGHRHRRELRYRTRCRHRSARRGGRRRRQPPPPAGRPPGQGPDERPGQQPGRPAPGPDRSARIQDRVSAAPGLCRPT